MQFVENGAIDVLYYEKPYFVLPADDLAQQAYGVLRDALRATGKAGVGQISVRGREQLVSVRPCGKGLIMEVLRYADEVTKVQNSFRDIPAVKHDPDLIEMATTRIEKKTAPFKPEAFRDHYIDALQRLIEKKRKAGGGKRILENVDDGDSGKRANVIDLMAALKKSVGTAVKDPPAKKAAPRRKAR